MTPILTACPECHGRTDLLLVKLDRLVKKCLECNHRWNEPREAPRPVSKTWLPRNPQIRSSAT